MGLDDRFSEYFDPEQYSRFREITDARFSGIGVSVQPARDGLRIVEVYDDAPADKAALRKGDVIVAVDGRRIAGGPEEAATSRIKGRGRRKERHTNRRGGRPPPTKVGRAHVSIPVTEA